MSSTYLTSKNMKMIECLLSHSRERGGFNGFETSAARLLVKRVENGTFVECRLQIVLRRHIVSRKMLSSALSQWDREGGSIPQEVAL